MKHDDRFRRDFETPEAYRLRMLVGDDEPEEPKAPAEAEDDLPSPWVVDAGPLYTSARDRRAIQAYEDRISRLDRRDRGR